MTHPQTHSLLTQQELSQSRAIQLESELDVAQLCINCLRPKHTQRVCPHCGYDERHFKQHPLYLRPRTLLKNQYVIGKPLGQGGFGVTYVGFDQWLQKQIAIKEYLPAAMATRDFLKATIIPLKQQEQAFAKGLQLFISEARNLALFDHPSIVRVLNFFEANQTGYMVMDYLEGDSPTDILCKKGGCLTTEQALSIIFPILAALAEIHTHHIYHRDISVQNICILTTGTPVLIDFGAARHVVGEHSRSLDLVLKHGYSPLEQYSGRGKIGAWTDIYATGALLYLLITGNLPPAATDRFYEDTLVPPTNLPHLTVPQHVSDAILKALAIKWEDRFQTVADFKAALEGKTPVILLNPAVAEPKRSVWQRYSHFWGLILALGLFILVFTGGLWLGTQNDTHNATQQLFSQAQQQWQQQKLIAPDEDNAYATYQQILTLMPHNAQANAGIQQIVDFYQRQARQAANQGHFAQSFGILQPLLEVMPQHVGLREFEQTLLAEAVSHEQQQQQTSELVQLLTKAAFYFDASQLDNAYQAYQAALELEADNATARQGLAALAEKYETLARAQQENVTASLFLVRQGLAAFPNHIGLLSLQETLQTAQRTQQQRVAALLAQAERQLAALQLTEPPDNNAYDTFQTLLQLAPENTAARKGFSRIADQYEQLARQEQIRDPTKSLLLVSKGLNILPTHAGLLALSQTLQNAQLAAQTTDAEVAPMPVPTESDVTVTMRLAEARQHLQADRLSQAYQLYQQVLQQNPHHVTAQQGITRIATRYSQLAQQAYTEQAFAQSLTWVTQGLAIAPHSADLLALQHQLQQRIATSNPAPTPPSPPEAQASENVIFTPSF